MSDNFVHLHNHTEYSMLDGAARIKELYKKVQGFDMPAVAITDHGNMFGAHEFYRQAKSTGWTPGSDTGVKPIIGLEAYLSPDVPRTHKKAVKWGDESQKRDDVSGNGAYTHMTMWAENNTGMHNMFKLSSRASLEGMYFKPRMDKELLSTYHEGIIGTTGCPSGEVQTRLRLGQFDLAKKAAGEYQDIFGKDNYFCELMDHSMSIDLERKVRPELLKIAKDLNIPLVATNDLHYVEQADAKAHSALLCIQTNATIHDPNRFQFDGDGYYVKSAAEMRRIFKDHPDACDNTLLIAERCNVEFDDGDDAIGKFMPKFDVPAGETEESWLHKEVQKGLHYRYPSGIPEDVQRQADYELGVISQMGFNGYFLVVADFITWAKDNGIKVGPGRGSGAGSMVAYAMRITDLDPLEHGLIFERFLNPERLSMPDFDVDFDDRRRPEVIKYVTEKYGDDRVAMIVTYGTLSAKAALKDAARVLGLPYQSGEKLTKAMPAALMGKEINLATFYDENAPRYKEAQEAREVIEASPELKEVYDTALGLEGLKRQWGVHAAGVIMSDVEIQDIIPVMKREDDGQIITQFDYPTCESLGLIKMDFLGLRNLTILDDALKNIKASKGEDIDLDQLTFDDKKTYELLASGVTLGVFQLDGAQLQELLKQMQPDNFEDISACIALYRPGPMGANSHINYALRKTGKQEITPIHPELEEPLQEILGTTYGLIVYQEQVMSIAQKLAGFSLGQADILRRAMGKKKKEELDKQFEGFRQGMIDNGYSDDAVDTLWEILVPFSDYAFNKAHSAAYAVISYWTGYLKANYPVEYMAALLTNVANNKDKMALYLNECRRMGIDVLEPDVNESTQFFSAVGENIRFGMAAMRNVGTGVVEHIEKAREEKGAFESYEDFLTKVPEKVLNKRTIASLVQGGAFDSLGYNRRALDSIVEESIHQMSGIKKKESIGQFDLFGSLESEETTGIDSVAIAVPDLPEWDKKEKLGYEREVLGMYVSDHPLKGVENALERHSDWTVHQILTSPEIKDRQSVKVAGLITSLEIRVAKTSQKRYASVILEDQTGSILVMFFSNTLEPIAPYLKEDLVVSIEGTIMKEDEGGVKINAKSMKILEADELSPNPAVYLCFQESHLTQDALSQLLGIMKEHPGKHPVVMNIETALETKKYSLPGDLNVSADTNFMADLKAAFGANCIDR